MRLNKIQDLSKRPITNIELVSRYLFGDSFPAEFKAGDYKAGDYAYQIKPNGLPSVYYCTETGHYELIDSKWVAATIPAMITKLIEDNIKNGISVDIDDVSELKQSGLYKFDTYTTKDLLSKSGTTKLTLPIEYDKNLYEVELYINGLRKSLLDNQYTISGNTITTPYTLFDTDDIVVTILRKCDPAARLIYTMELHPDVVAIDTAGTVLTIPVPYHTVDKSLVFDLYLNGKYISQNDYSFSFDTVNYSYVVMLSNEITPDSNPDHYNFVFTCSMSKEITIVKNDIQKTCKDDPNRFQMDMKYTDFNDISIIYNSFNDGKLIPNTATVLYNSTVHITDEKYYMNKASEYTITYKNIIINSIFGEDDELTNDFQEVIYVTDYQANARKVPIPFIEYDKDINTLLVFKGDGYLVSSTRYYVKDNILTFYPHDNSLNTGDRLVFQILNNDYSIASYMKTLTINQYDIDHGIKLPLIDHDEDSFDVLLFDVTGMYISSDKYEVNKNVVTFNDNMNISPGDNIEFIMFDYITPRTNTTMKLYRTNVSSETKVALPFGYDGSTDNIILFQSNGMYIDRSRYEISQDGIITLISGQHFNVPDFVDIFLFRKYRDSIEVITVPDRR